MKKLSKTAWLALGVGIFVIAFAALYMLYSQQSSEQSRLDRNLKKSEATMTTIATEKRDAENRATKLDGQLTQLENELKQAKSQLSSSKSAFSAAVESIEFGERLFATANSWLLKVTNFTASKPAEEEIQDTDFAVTTFTVKVRGQVDDILGYVNTIIMDPYFNAATIKIVNLNVPRPLDEGEKEELDPEEIEERENPSATITLTVYNY